MQVKAEIVAIGSELLLGQIVDTNSAWMAQRLADIGVNLFYKRVVGDIPDRMKEVISRALDRSDIVITSGGLGPTQDDITREIVAEVANQKLIEDPELIKQIEERFHRRGVLITPNNLIRTKKVETTCKQQKAYNGQRTEFSKSFFHWFTVIVN